MRRGLALALLVVLMAVAAPAAQPAFAQGFGAAGPADVILSNGKIVTVDDRFQVAQAVAVRGDRVLAVGR